MPTNKDFKRLVRARMQKTGEAYTAARSHLLKKKQVPAPLDYAKLAGMSDAAVKAKTGCTWERWVRALDRVAAHTWPHRQIADYVHEKYKVPGWWTQTVTVGYGRIKGLRGVGQRRGGGFEATKSKVFAVPLARLYRAWSDTSTRARWLPGVDLTIRTATRGKSMRITWPDRTSVEVYFTGKSAGKSQVQVQHRKLPDRSAATRMKQFWGATACARKGAGAGRPVGRLRCRRNAEGPARVGPASLASRPPLLRPQPAEDAGRQEPVHEPIEAILGRQRP